MEVHNDQLHVQNILTTDNYHYSSLKDWGGILLRVSIYLGGFLVALYGIGYITRNII